MVNMNRILDATFGHNIIPYTKQPPEFQEAVLYCTER
jgi:hypothetical protein